MNKFVVVGGGGLLFAGALFWSFRVLPDSPSDDDKAGFYTGERPMPSRPNSSRIELLASGISLITDPATHWEERILAVRDLPSNLGDQSVEHLFSFLSNPPDSGEENWYLVCNEIMEILRKRSLAPEVYTSRLLSLIESKDADPIIRDYAVQHLAQWIAGIVPEAREADGELVKSAFAAMLAEAGKPENGGFTLSGTTVHALADAVTNGSAVLRERRDEVSQLALAIIENQSFSSVNRSSAIQAAARLRADGLPEICRGMAADAQVPADLRLSSIAALGLVGSEDDILFIQGFVDDEAYKFAAVAAIERLAPKQR